MTTADDMYYMLSLAIKGHVTRGKEVIEILEMLGGRNSTKLIGTASSCGYYIDSDGNIAYHYYSYFKDAMQFTIEEFLEKYPYKVGDKVNYVKYNDEYQDVYTIQRMRWTGVTIEYLLDSSGFSALTKDLQPYKEETMEKEISGAIIDRFICLEGYDFYDDKGNIIDTKEITMKKKHPEYPKTFIEVLNFWHPDRHLEDDYQRCYKKDLLEKFQDLLYARDAYWKIAGVEMGLDKPWEPDWLNVEQDKYVLYTNNNSICSNCFSLGNNILAFPTAKMRDAFYENFKDLIEECKELL